MKRPRDIAERSREINAFLPALTSSEGYRSECEPPPALEHGVRPTQGRRTKRLNCADQLRGVEVRSAS
jgi:hypothetical protein